MSTFPRVQNEGGFALPNVPSLARLPESFGREWAFTRPDIGLHAEDHAFYAAILSTVSLSLEAFIARARWDDSRNPVPLPPAPVPAPITQLMVGGALAALGTSPERMPPSGRN